MSQNDPLAQRPWPSVVMVALAIVILSIAAVPTWAYERVGWQHLPTFATAAPTHDSAYPAPSDTPTPASYPPPATPSPTAPPGAYLSNGHYVVPEPVNYARLAWLNRFRLALLPASLLIGLACLFTWRHRNLAGLWLGRMRVWARSHWVIAAIGAIVLVGLTASVFVWWPLVPLPADSGTAQELRGVFAGIDNAPRQIICRGLGTDYLSQYYANTPDFHLPNDQDPSYLAEMTYITPTLGLAARNEAGLLTAKEAMHIWFYQLQHRRRREPSSPDPHILQQLDISCDHHIAEPTPAVPAPRSQQRTWVNASLTMAVVSQDDCDSMYSLFRKIDGHWKIVKDQFFPECPGQ